MGSLGVRWDIQGPLVPTRSPDTPVQIPFLPMAGVVRIKGRFKHLALSETGITISGNKPSPNITELSIVWCDVIGCETDPTQNCNKNEVTNQAFTDLSATIVIHYIQHNVKDKTLKPEKVKVMASPQNVAMWTDMIRECGRKVPGRPCKPLTIINPISGDRLGPKVFTKHVEPVLRVAGIQSRSITTEREREAVELLENLDLSEYDSLILLGGDGLYHEVLEGLTKQIQRRSGVNIDNPDAEFRPIDIPIAIIPTGTGNAVSRWANGITDIKTAILNIIRGKVQHAQISSVHSNGKFLRMSGVNVVYGMMSDMIKHSDRLRWMKAKRYRYAMLAMVVGRKRLFDCKVEYKTSSGQPHNAQGEQNIEMSHVTSSESETNNSWHTYDPQGNPYRGLMSFSCDLDLSEPSRKNAVQYLTGDSTHLLIDHNILAPKYLKYLLNYISPVKSTNTSSKLSVLQDVTAYRFRLTENEEERSQSCCRSAPKDKDKELELFVAMDGESIPLETATLDVRIRKAYVPLYGCVDQNQGFSYQDGVKNSAFELTTED